MMFKELYTNFMAKSDVGVEIERIKRIIVIRPSDIIS